MLPSDLALHILQFAAIFLSLDVFLALNRHSLRDNALLIIILYMALRIMQRLRQLAHVEVARGCLDLRTPMHELSLLMHGDLQLGCLQQLMPRSSMAKCHICLHQKILESFMVVLQWIQSVDILEVVFGALALRADRRVTHWRIPLVEFGHGARRCWHGAGDSFRFALHCHISLGKLSGYLLLFL